jgi:hypothetical protein
VGTPEELAALEVARDALDRRSAHNVARSADLVRALDRDLNERHAHLVAVDDSLRRVRALTAAVEVRARAVSAGYQDVSSGDESQVAGISPPR